jgi:hypothetical protein
MPRLDAQEVKKRLQQVERAEYIDEQIDKCKEDDPIQLSDLIVNAGTWGGTALVCLGNLRQDRLQRGDKQMLWKLKVVRDEWGNKLSVGDKVIKKTQKSLLDRNKQPIKPNVMSHAIQDGSYEQQFFQTKEFEVDKKGCIECDFHDAVYFLNVWGLHSETRRALTTKKEMSREPVNAPNGQKLHCHYWRFQEMTKAQYDNLPNVKKRTEPLRGLEELEIIEMFDEESTLKKDIKSEERKQQIIDEAKKAKSK